MTKRWTVAALALFVGAALAQPGTAQSLDEVLERHYEAIGGADAWKSLQTMRASGTLSVAGGMAEGPFDLAQKRPAMYRLDLEIMGTSIVQAYDGEIAWQINPMSGAVTATRASAEEAELIIENSDLDGPLIGWREDGHTVELVGSETAGGVDAFKLEVTTNGNTNFYFIDANSYELVMVESSTAGVSATTRMSDFRDVGGLLFPFAIEIDTAQGLQSLTFDSIEVNVDIDDARFSMDGR